MQSGHYDLDEAQDRDDEEESEENASLSEPTVSSTFLSDRPADPLSARVLDEPEAEVDSVSVSVSATRSLSVAVGVKPSRWEGSAPSATTAPTAGRRARQSSGHDSSDDDHGASDLASYINRLTRTPLLTALEEQRLAFKVRSGDMAAKMKMVESNLRLVVSIAKSYLSSGIPMEDLIQEGSIGLMTAAERFDPERGYRFSTYATQWIRQAIGRAVDNKAKAIRLPAHVSESLRKVEKAKFELRRQIGEEPSTEQIAAAAGISMKKMNNLVHTTQDPVSLDMPVGDEENTPLGNLLFDKSSPDPQESLISAEMRCEIEEILESLDEREQIIMRNRFGFEDSDRHVLQQIGEQLGISRERVRQLEAQAIRKLRTAARKRRLREYLQT
jgi:RNA polymerase primary sigma factor